MALVIVCGPLIVGAPVSKETVTGALAVTISVLPKKFVLNCAANWAGDNKALVNRGSLTFWFDESAIQAWYDEPKTSSRGRLQRYSELVIFTVLMLKRVFLLTLRAAQGFIDSIFILMKRHSAARMIPTSADEPSP